MDKGRKLGLLTLGDSNDPVSRASQRKRKKEEDDFEREREKDRGTNVRNKVAMVTASELKRRVDLEEQKFQYQKTENLMVNIQMQISAVKEHIATTVEMIKHGAPTTLANWNMVSKLNVEMKELRSKLQLIQTEMEKEEEIIKIEKE